MPVSQLFTEGRAVGTILLWVPFFMNLLIIYFIVNWLPSLLRQGGMPVSAGVAAISFFSLGGIAGALGEGRLMTAFGAYPVLVAEFGISTLLIGALAYASGSYLGAMAVTFVLGVTVQGAQAGINAASASFYPTSMRSTGVGWALGVGRIGSIIGPVLGGVLLSMTWTPQQILLSGTVPALCATVAVLISNLLQTSASAYRSAPSPGESS
jgi:AAHS family 4-hydroxybenzoate transporter-like MFS transporter